MEISTTNALRVTLGYLYNIITEREIPIPIESRIAAAEALGRLCLSVEDNLLLREEGFLLPVQSHEGSPHDEGGILYDLSRSCD